MGLAVQVAPEALVALEEPAARVDRVELVALAGLATRWTRWSWATRWRR